MFTRRFAFEVGQRAGDAANERSSSPTNYEAESVVKLKPFPIDFAIRGNDIAFVGRAEASKLRQYVGLVLLSAREFLAVAEIEIAEVIERLANPDPPLFRAQQCLVAVTLSRNRERAEQLDFPFGEYVCHLTQV